MPRNEEWTFDEVDQLCRRAFMEGVDHGKRTNPYYQGGADEAWEVSKVAGELGEMCS